MAKKNLYRKIFIGLMGIAGILMIIGFFFPWAKAGTLEVKGFEDNKAILTFLGGWISIIGSMIGYDLFHSRALENMKPIVDSGLGIIGGILALIGVLIFTSDIPEVLSTGWGLYLVIAGIVIGLISAIMMYLVGESGIFKGRRTRRKKSGGL